MNFLAEALPPVPFEFVPMERLNLSLPTNRTRLSLLALPDRFGGLRCLRESVSRLLFPCAKLSLAQKADGT